MAVKTQFSEAEFIRILENYHLGELRSAQPILSGTVQTNYLLETSGGKFIFRCYENRSLDSACFECNLIHYLNRHQFPCPAAIRNRNRRFVGQARGKPFALFEFITGTPLEHPTYEQHRQLIQTVAGLHRLTCAYRPRGWQARWNYSPALCRQLVSQIADDLGTPSARAKRSWYLDALDRLDLPRGLPKGVCHCDFDPSNVLYRNGQLVALIDFDDANVTYLAFDLLGLMNPFAAGFEWNTWQHFAPDAPILDLRQARAVAAEYDRYRPLLPLEQRHLFDVCKLGVLIDCLWYFARGDMNDFYEKRKIDALERLGREQFAARMFA